MQLFSKRYGGNKRDFVAHAAENKSFHIFDNHANNHGFASLHKQIAPIQDWIKGNVVLVLEEIQRTIEARERSEEQEVVRTWPRNSVLTFEMEFWKKLCVREARERSSPPNNESSRTCALKMKKSLPFSNTGTTYGAMERFPNGFDQLYFRFASLRK